MTSKTDKTFIYQSFTRFILLVLMILWAPGAVYVDIVLFEHRVPEHGLTELSQELMIGISALIFTVLAVKNSHQRGFYILVAGLFWSMLIRELDHDLDKISHGFWKWPVSFVVVGALMLAYRYRHSIVSEMARVTHSVPFNTIIIGLAVLLFFSRVFGTSNFWTPILEQRGIEGSASLIKSVVQEGIELLGYSFIFYGTVWFAMTRRHKVRTENEPDRLF